MTFAADLLTWYDQHHRHLPWRANPGHTPNPYYVWISEIMLQQTTVPTVVDYFNRFIQRWPTIHDLATASIDEVLHAWQGLGYYSRARNLHKCAQEIMAKHDGVVPTHEQGLLTLPGIGPYTAAAIAAIAFNKPAAVVDGNIERIVTRVYKVDTPLPQAKPIIKEYVKDLTPTHRPGDFAQAMMDLGAGVCKPKNPLCGNCPVQNYCGAFKDNQMDMFPIKPPKVKKPTRYGYVYLIFNKAGQVLLEKRPHKGLLGGMMGFPSSNWEEALPTNKHLKTAPGRMVQITDITIKHTFTHFHLYLTIVTTTVATKDFQGIWVYGNELKKHALPTLMKKVWRAYTLKNN